AHCRRGLLAPTLDQGLDRHLAVRDEPPIANDLGSTTPGQPTQTDAFARHHPLEQHSPPLSRRRSPNRPTDQSIADIPAPRTAKSATHRITSLGVRECLTIILSHSVAPRCVHPVALGMGSIARFRFPCL